MSGNPSTLSAKRRIKVLAPNINDSTDTFRVIDNNILMPLTSIDGLGPSSVMEILKVRSDKTFDDFEDFINRASEILTPQLIENIIYSGALDSFKLTKKTMIDNYGIVSNRKKYSFVKNMTNVTYDNEEFSYGYLLEKEQLVLGINLKYNFMFQYEGYFRKKMATCRPIPLGPCSRVGARRGCQPGAELAGEPVDAHPGIRAAGQRGQRERIAARRGEAELT